MKKLVVAMLALSILAGCGAKKKTTVCTYEEEGIKDVITIESTGSKVNFAETVTEMDLEALYGEIEEEELIEFIAEVEKDYNDRGVKGFSLTVERIGDTSTIKMVEITDYKKADFQQLSDLNIVTTSNGKKADYVDYDLTINGLTNEGYNCK